MLFGLLTAKGKLFVKWDYRTVSEVRDMASNKQI